ncbi:hypothetical protein [Candidatus Methanomassiliicoccus intestinalis]|uniref:hypothetical protein n=3 Tax=Candidatus Methanomassiliicoccus intestinalis TaxID=1406512 RepID=UPI0037DD9B83
MRIRDLLGNNPLVLTVALIIALVCGGFPETEHITNKDIAMVSLCVMMCFSLCNMKLAGLNPKHYSKDITKAFFCCMVLGLGVTVLISFFFEGDIRHGWILEAAVPSAVSVIPFTALLLGNMKSAIVSSTVIYFAALLVTPLVTLIFLGEAIDPMTLLEYIALLIIIPLIVSRFMRRLSIPPAAGTIVINLSFAVLVVAIAGSNNYVFFGEPVLLVSLLIAAVLRTFGVGICLNALLKKKGEAREDRVPEILFATHKNTGMAGALAVALIGDAAAIPAAVCMTVDIVWLIYISKFMFPAPKLKEEQPASSAA